MKKPASGARKAKRSDRADDLFARSIKTTPDGEMALTWQERPTLPKPAATPFTLEDGLRRLREITSLWARYWTDANIPEHPSREEAQFWVMVVERLDQEDAVPCDAADALAGIQLDGQVSAERIRNLENNWAVSEYHAKWALRPIMFNCAIALLDPGEFIGPGGHDESWLVKEAEDKFRHRIFPYLSATERAALCRQIEQYSDERASLTGAHSYVSSFYHAGAVLGCCAAELRALFEQVPDGEYRHQGDEKILWLLFGLGDAATVEKEWRRLGAGLHDAAQARAWVAVTGYGGVDVIADTARSLSVWAEIARNSRGELLAKITKIARSLLLVAAPEAAVPALRLVVETQAQTVGQKWLAEHPGHAAVGLTPLAMEGEGKLAVAARKHLQGMLKDGLAPILERATEHLTPEQGAWLRKDILGGKAKTTPKTPEVKLPESLRAAFGQVKAVRPKPWLSASALPPVEVAGAALPRAEVELLLAELRRVAPGETSELLARLKEFAEARSLDLVALKIFEQWSATGQPASEKWVLGNLGLLGGDHLAAAVAAQVRVWPDDNKLMRAKSGVDCLAAIGTDAALNALKDFSLKHRWSLIRSQSTGAMEAIAKRRGMTVEDLADHTAPDAGLDEKGTRVLDFGPRQFTLTVGPDLQPTLRDATGQTRTDLPAPAKSDDAKLADRAVEDWKLCKKTLRETLRVQVRRLEDRMIHGRRWTPEGFRRLILGHPLLVRLARRLVLGVYAQDGRLEASFRITEDRTFADAHDAVYTLPDAGSIGVVHPVQLDDATLAAWRGTFDDYNLVPPFAQIGRVVCRAQADDLKREAITRFAGRPVPALHLFGTLEGDRWTRGDDDEGELVTHEKYFEAADQTAVIRYSGLSVFNVKEAPPQEVETVRFLRGKPDYGWENKPDKILQVKDVDAVVLSEALRVAAAIVEPSAAA